MVISAKATPLVAGLATRVTLCCRLGCLRLAPSRASQRSTRRGQGRASYAAGACQNTYQQTKLGGNLSEKTCKKCGHTIIYNGLEPQSCPACGAIYAKVEEALRAAADARAIRNTAANAVQASRVSAPTAAARGDVPAMIDVHAYAANMRDDSLYPFWRKLVGLVTIMGYILAGMVLIGALVAMSNASVTAGLVGVGGAVFVAVMVRVGKEASLMLADLSDASVRMAAQREAK